MPNKKDYVILLHGFWRTNKSMQKLADSLAEAGYEVINLNYPSKKEKIEDLANNYLYPCLLEKCPDKKKKIHFVAHSMGGIIVRYFLAHYKIQNLGKVVLLATPNQGTKLADYLSRSSLINFVMGPALEQLKTTDKSLPKLLPPPNYEVGIIAGKYDEKVPRDSTKLKNMKDFILIPSLHTNIMNSPRVIQAVKKFLKKGEF